MEEKHGCDCFCRVDGKEVLHLPQRRLSFDCKASKFSQQGDILGMEKVSQGGTHLGGVQSLRRVG